MTHGIHHITAISSNPQRTLDFYTTVLGLRFIKKTVNFDSPDTYHFYFGNEIGEPGTILTFFPFVHSGTGTRGSGQVTKIMFAVPGTSFGFWLERFIAHHVKHNGISKEFGKSVLTFFDFDGLQLQLVAVDKGIGFDPWTTENIPDEHALRGFFGAELSVAEYTETEKILVENFGYEYEQNEDLTYRYKHTAMNGVGYIDLIAMRGWPEGVISAGTIHHIAFRVADRAAETELRSKLLNQGMMPTEPIDRNYFYSVYFREPNGVLFEIATDEPGFMIDEDQDTLGSTLKLPEQYEPLREQLEMILPELHDPLLQYKSDDRPKGFVHKFIKRNGSNRIFLLMHGTGGDEDDLVPLAKIIDSHVSILTLRGNTTENGMNRFFERYENGTFNQDNLISETRKLHEFLQEASNYYGFSFEDIVILGYSNGANFGLSYIFTYPEKIHTGLFLHPMVPFQPKEDLSLKNSRILVTAGRFDPYSTSETVKTLSTILQNSDAQLTVFTHDGGHELNEDEIKTIKEFYSSIDD